MHFMYFGSLKHSYSIAKYPLKYVDRNSVIYDSNSATLNFSYSFSIGKTSDKCSQETKS